jgi:hypothetical protein
VKLQFFLNSLIGILLFSLSFLVSILLFSGNNKKPITLDSPNAGIIPIENVSDSISVPLSEPSQTPTTTKITTPHIDVPLTNIPLTASQQSEIDALKAQNESTRQNIERMSQQTAEIESQNELSRQKAISQRNLVDSQTIPILSFQPWVPPTIDVTPFKPEVYVPEPSGVEFNYDDQALKNRQYCDSLRIGLQDECRTKLGVYRPSP